MAAKDKNIDGIDAALTRQRSFPRSNRCGEVQVTECLGQKKQQSEVFLKCSALITSVFRAKSQRRGPLWPARRAQSHSPWKIIIWLYERKLQYSLIIGLTPLVLSNTLSCCFLLLRTCYCFLFCHYWHLSGSFSFHNVPPDLWKAR